MYYTYVLRSHKDNNLYIGSTSNIDRRLVEHNSGKNRSTKYRRPLTIVYFEKYKTLEESKMRERQFKNSHSVLYKAAGWRDKHK